MRVNDCVAGACVLPCVCPHPFHQRRTDLLPKPALDCGVIKIGHCGVRWKVVGQISPFTAVIHEIQHCIYQLPLFPFAPVSCRWEQRFDDCPLVVAQITRIPASLIFLYHAYILAPFYLLVQLLKSCNAILFDIHGEYSPITGAGIQHYKIAGPSDVPSEQIMFLPYWLLSYEEMLALMLDRSDSNAHNQAMIFSQAVMKEKISVLEETGRNELASEITLDSPVPYRITQVLDFLDAKNVEMVPGSGTREKQGDFHGKLPRFIQRLNAKMIDKRLNFMFSDSEELLDVSYMETLCKQLMAPASQGGGIKILDFSEVPSDILPLIVSLLARIVFSVQQWMDRTKLNPLAIFCDEAHLYIPANAQQGVELSSLQSFERIAKEGRKYGIGLVIVSQRPSEVNRTVLSQSSNFIAMRLTNADDQAVIKKLLPDSIGNFADLLPILDIGEAIAVGDASLLPSRIIIDIPRQKPNSATVKFWDEWSKESVSDDIAAAVQAMRRQGR